MLSVRTAPAHLCSRLTLFSLHAAYWSAFTSRENLKVSAEQGNPARLLLNVNGPHDQVHATIKRMIFPIQNREFVGHQVCATDTNGDLLVTYEPVNDEIDYGVKYWAVRGVSRVFMRFTPSGESQCKAALIQ